MPEICREPITITVDGVDYTAFDEDHTIADIARWVHKEDWVDDLLWCLEDLTK